MPLCNRFIELEEETNGTKAKMAKLEERATQQEVQLGRVEVSLLKRFSNSARLKRSSLRTLLMPTEQGLKTL